MSKSFVSSLTLSITSSKEIDFFAHISVNETSDYNRSSVFLHNPGIKRSMFRQYGPLWILLATDT